MHMAHQEGMEQFFPFICSLACSGMEHREKDRVLLRTPDQNIVPSVSEKCMLVSTNFLTGGN